jgi:hypothetical protein
MEPLTDYGSMNEERARLVRHISESVRLICPTQRLDEFFKFRQRLLKTDLETLRRIVEEDAVNLVAAQFPREGLFS